MRRARIALGNLQQWDNPPHRFCIGELFDLAILVDGVVSLCWMICSFPAATGSQAEQLATFSLACTMRQRVPQWRNEYKD
jgi:hypothetical protein